MRVLSKWEAVLFLGVGWRQSIMMQPLLHVKEAVRLKQITDFNIQFNEPVQIYDGNDVLTRYLVSMCTRTLRWIIITHANKL